jgi:hypothetical protein
MLGGSPSSRIFRTLRTQNPLIDFSSEYSSPDFLRCLILRAMIRAHGSFFGWKDADDFFCAVGWLLLCSEVEMRLFLGLGLFLGCGRRHCGRHRCLLGCLPLIVTPFGFLGLKLLLDPFSPFSLLQQQLLSSVEFSCCSVPIN